MRHSRRNDEQPSRSGVQRAAGHHVAAPSGGDEDQFRAVVTVQIGIPASEIPAAVKKFRFHHI
ncbi:hypothetical protein SDC9_200200 [bioreactor metagenome]|uniref:Uncharacterized protein n=1 Tax=bioreactor metagenome TaxID=1076179 RepID=A0A645IML0_9ZZZZ